MDRQTDRPTHPDRLATKRPGALGAECGAGAAAETSPARSSTRTAASSPVAMGTGTRRSAQAPARPPAPPCPAPTRKWLRREVTAQAQRRASWRRAVRGTRWCLAGRCARCGRHVRQRGQVSAGPERERPRAGAGLPGTCRAVGESMHGADRSWDHAWGPEALGVIWGAGRFAACRARAPLSRHSVPGPDLEVSGAQGRALTWETQFSCSCTP